MLRLADGFAAGDVDGLVRVAGSCGSAGRRSSCSGSSARTADRTSPPWSGWSPSWTGCRWTFHRAIDRSADRDALRKQLADLPGLDTYLTAGSAAGVDDGLPVLLAEAARRGEPGYDAAHPGRRRPPPGPPPHAARRRHRRLPHRRRGPPGRLDRPGRGRGRTGMAYDPGHAHRPRDRFALSVGGSFSAAGPAGRLAQFPAPLKDQALRAWKTTACGSGRRRACGPGRRWACGTGRRRACGPERSTGLGDLEGDGPVGLEDDGLRAGRRRACGPERRRAWGTGRRRAGGPKSTGRSPCFSGARGTAREAPPDPHPTTHPARHAPPAKPPAGATRSGRTRCPTASPP